MLNDGSHETGVPQPPNPDDKEKKILDELHRDTERIARGGIGIILMEDLDEHREMPVNSDTVYFSVKRLINPNLNPPSYKSPSPKVMIDMFYLPNGGEFQTYTQAIDTEGHFEGWVCAPYQDRKTGEWNIHILDEEQLRTLKNMASRLPIDTPNHEQTQLAALNRTLPQK